MSLSGAHAFAMDPKRHPSTRFCANPLCWFRASNQIKPTNQRGNGQGTCRSLLFSAVSVTVPSLVSILLLPSHDERLSPRTSRLVKYQVVVAVTHKASWTTALPNLFGQTHISAHVDYLGQRGYVFTPVRLLAGSQDCRNFWTD
ncbi:unnamed protein product [Pleuronectes platessa]|uniref:Uncharacterized protein n=1 Tax=Pleuronectes platessa TaxID=8262 RepID=A0A9N7VD32_PLEPL|nr:unnamed protein product [Pleuronectes platessa]